MKVIASAEKPLLELLVAAYPETSKTTLRSWIEKGRVTVAGLLAKKASTLVLKGQEIAVSHKNKLLDLGIQVLYEDADLIVIDKPAGVLSVSTDFESKRTAHSVIKHHAAGKRVYPVHRLDRETSGVMVFAYSEKARGGLKKLFHDHQIDRVYGAIVEGVPRPLEGEWKSYLRENATYYVRSTKKQEEGKLAVTHYSVKAKNSRSAYLEIRLETGKKNQIRVHCSEAGYPIAGDKKYGARTNPFKRLCLHAILLGFLHPVTGKKLSFERPFPIAFQ